MSSLITYLRQNWERVLLLISAALLCVAAAAWILHWGEDRHGEVASAAIPTPDSLLNPQLAFAFRSEPGEFVVNEPHPFFFVLPEKPKRPDRPWVVWRPEKPEKPEKPAKPDKPDKTVVEVDIPAKPEEPEKPEKPEDPVEPEPPKPIPKVQLTYLGWMKTPSGQQRALIRYAETGQELFVSQEEKIREILPIEDFSPEGLTVKLPDGTVVTLAKGETKNLPLE